MGQDTSRPMMAPQLGGPGMPQRGFGGRRKPPNIGGASHRGLLHAKVWCVRQLVEIRPGEGRATPSLSLACLSCLFLLYYALYYALYYTLYYRLKYAKNLDLF
jgi:hypothetical protein